MIKIDENTTLYNYVHGIEFLYEENDKKEIFYFPNIETALRFYFRKSLSKGSSISEVNKKIEKVKKQIEND